MVCRHGSHRSSGAAPGPHCTLGVPPHSLSVPPPSVCCHLWAGRFSQFHLDKAAFSLGLNYDGPASSDLSVAQNHKLAAGLGNPVVRPGFRVHWLLLWAQVLHSGAWRGSQHPSCLGLEQYLATSGAAAGMFLYCCQA
ncbi:UNVERIFIED_CONTAM: hypothetical protein K2H54_056608 [Gekko kuhli]